MGALGPKMEKTYTAHFTPPIIASLQQFRLNVSAVGEDANGVLCVRCGWFLHTIDLMDAIPPSPHMPSTPLYHGAILDVKLSLLLLHCIASGIIVWGQNESRAGQ
jgi:hypothetical protein